MKHHIKFIAQKLNQLQILNLFVSMIETLIREFIKEKVV